MKCPHCTIAFADNWSRGHIHRSNSQRSIEWQYRTALCPECRKFTVQVGKEPPDANEVSNWITVDPLGANRGPVPKDVPASIAADYIEACNVLPISPKASAALSRRCLQSMLHAHGYSDRNLMLEITALLNETDPRKAIPETLRAIVDGVRHFGNFGAHPVTDLTSTQIIDVEDHEAEWCLEILEEAFQHFYVRPAEAVRRRAALDAKLAAAGKHPSK